jgi:hypothetical protein
MPKRKSKKTPGSPRALVLLAALALIAFVAGEAWRLMDSDAWRLKLARYLGFGDPARITLTLSREARRGLTAYGIQADSIHELAPLPAPGGSGSRSLVRWRVGLKPDQSPLQANYAVSHFVEDAGGAVLSGREAVNSHGEATVTMRIGLPGRPTHEITLVRAPRGRADAARAPARLALVLFGLGDDPVPAAEALGMQVPFAVAIAPGAPTSGALFRAARDARREIVLHLPLEPVNYPQVNPGPGTVLVTMRPAEITGLTHRYLDQAGTVAAVANYMGSLATQDMSVMSAVYRELKRRHLPFIHVTPAAGAVCRSLAAQMGILYAEPDAIIDAETRGSDPRALDRRWNEVLAAARGRDGTVVWLRASPLVRGWLARATAANRIQGVDLVPLSSLLRRPAEL